MIAKPKYLKESASNDIVKLISQFVSHSKEISFESFGALWVKHNYSVLQQCCPKSVAVEDYEQLLYSIALGQLDGFTSKIALEVPSVQEVNVHDFSYRIRYYTMRTIWNVGVVFAIHCLYYSQSCKRSNHLRRPIRLDEHAMMRLYAFLESLEVIISSYVCNSSDRSEMDSSESCLSGLRTCQSILKNLFARRCFVLCQYCGPSSLLNAAKRSISSALLERKEITPDNFGADVSEIWYPSSLTQLTVFQALSDVASDNEYIRSLVVKKECDIWKHFVGAWEGFVNSHSNGQADMEPTVIPGLHPNLTNDDSDTNFESFHPQDLAVSLVEGLEITALLNDNEPSLNERLRFQKQRRLEKLQAKRERLLRGHPWQLHQTNVDESIMGESDVVGASDDVEAMDVTSTIVIPNGNALSLQSFTELSSRPEELGNLLTMVDEQSYQLGHPRVVRSTSTARATRVQDKTVTNKTPTQKRGTSRRNETRSLSSRRQDSGIGVIDESTNNSQNLNPVDATGHNVLEILNELENFTNMILTGHLASADTSSDGAIAPTTLKKSTTSAKRAARSNSIRSSSERQLVQQPSSKRSRKQSGSGSSISSTNGQSNFAVNPNVLAALQSIEIMESL